MLIRNLGRFLALVIAFGIAAAAVPVRAAEGLTMSPALNAKLDRLYLTAYDETIQRHALAQRDGTTYVSTGDIEAEWLRDASATVRPYIGLSQHDGDVQSKLRGVVARQAKYILKDPYANAFSRSYRVVERKFEVDSLLYPIWFAYDYYRQTGDRRIFTPEVRKAFNRVLSTMRSEQHHQQRSRYVHPQLANGGRGSSVRYTGMVWTGFRPSDDPVRYHYNIPVNMFAAVVMKDLTTIARDVWHDGRMASNAWGLSVQIQRGIEQYGTLQLKPFGRIYAYEVDGLGHANVMDDANIPSLLSIPYFGYLPKDNSLYLATRRFVLSDRNPYFFRGKYAEGVGSPHTPHGYVWPLALCVQALTSSDEREVSRVFGWIAVSDIGDHRLHESFNANWPETYTREDFAWPNALYAELVLTRRGELYAER
ncbi:glycosyl hydrolase [Vulcanimicrobium alpinum]|uniref:Glycosyl hydrolase n=1 Tax=Vulcanimicrobium alpinum TaxID=3016050 RepID=A0AAN2C8P6_UNVUL|nr:glycoside hydrolase family 125 protein [Vulcanimicrobium alpinum]BDE05715.1 glycosyl hydrolase [Vulcanimicrobium alpinum]